MQSQRKMMVALSIAALFLLGCAGSQVTPLETAQVNLRSYPKVIVAVTSSVAEDVQAEQADLQGLVVSKIQGLNAFQSVQIGNGNESTEGTLIVKVSISDIKKVGGTARFMLGAFAGKASMTTDVQLIEGNTGKLLGQYTVKGQSGGTGVSGGTDDAVMKTAEGIAQIFQQSTT